MNDYGFEIKTEVAIVRFTDTDNPELHDLVIYPISHIRVTNDSIWYKDEHGKHQISRDIISFLEIE